ncbi:penicillin-binding protein 1A [Desulfuromonas versatilis]|uniref:peptidoglycan glycosyltransferase n=1 Tax=Desulfuromonas versatilis TaxID=2802975 RepID=A0ABN6E422_9BACT|nr:PBP1A family penicillin-binding protein [Desulfuromonas versatilis]BCR07048.1 penicillin-binding protein 1A [Desulfuromonas versatilis]
MIGKLIRFSLFAGLGLGLAVLLGLSAAYLYVSKTLPKVETLADYRPPIITSVYSEDGGVIAEYYRERRIPVPVERMPGQLIEAFVAAEDSHFFGHKGIDLVSILRAALKNIKAGGIVQGGSTITQQVAKSLLLSPEKKFERKFKEAILAWRMEKYLSKQDILYLYLNQIYLGHSAYGVQAAAENYFDKNVEDLSLAECAMLAGLPQAPSRYSPYRHFGRAKERQKYVLGRMVDEGYISPEQAQQALGQELTIHPRVNVHIADAAYFTEQVRRYLEENYGEQLLYSGGLKVYTTMNLGMQQVAQQAVRENLRELDKRQGFRGVEKVLSADEEAAFLADQEQKLGDKLVAPGDLLDAVLTGGSGNQLEVRIGPFKGEIPRSGYEWAGPVRVVPRGQAAAAGGSGREQRMPVGSVLKVRVEKVKADQVLTLSLEQVPAAQGALVALDPRSGQVRAMVGGYDFAQSQFNRAIQARRLPGSAIKPIIYAAALDKGYTPATVILDTPVIYKQTSASGEQTEWKPRNYAEKFYGPTSFREALTHSHNVITIKILEDVGVSYVVNYARKLGIESPLARDLTLALGSSALTPLELATAYSVFASGGVRLTPTYITKIVDRDGKVLESIDPADFPTGVGSDQKLIRQSPERVISPETAYLITNLMESVVRDGTGWRAKSLGRPVAGKTGTTNDLKDAWFAGYVPQLVAISWVGFDQERPLGKKETGSRAAAPAWVSFMQEAVKGLEPEEFPVPDGIEFHPIDRISGLLTPEDNSEAYIEVFAPGTAPSRYALDESRPRARDFFKLDLQDN